MRALLRILSLLACLGVASLAGHAGEASSSARLTYTKSFKDRVPEYVQVVVRETGEATYEGRALDESAEPEAFRVSPEVTARLFALAAELNYFRGLELESRHEVAYLGEKTFAYEEDGQATRVSYNYTENAKAIELEQWFERIARGRSLLHELEFRLQFDQLGILATLREFERDFNAGRLVDYPQFAPVLERIANDPRLLRLAQIRAAELLRRIRGAPGRLQVEYGDQRSGWYYRLIVEEQGGVTYEGRRFDQPANPQPLKLPEAAAARLLELARQDNYFRGLAVSGEPQQLSGYRLTYEAGAEHNEVAFSQPPDATLTEMVHIFQQVLQQEHYRNRLRAALDADSVDLQVLLQELESAVARDALIDPKEFVPLLEQIANGSGHDPVTREQAQRLLTRLRASNERRPAP